MVGLVRPVRGAVRLFGRDVWRDRERALAKVGALVENPGLYNYMSARQNLWIFSKLAGRFDRKAVDEVIEKVGLSDRANDRVKAYSQGMRQRLGIAQALLCDPELVILDEPTNGLDPQGMKEVRELIVSLAKDHGITVFLSSHLLHEVQQVCTKVAVIHKGKKVASGAVSELLSGNGRYSITVTRPKEAAAAVEKLGFVTVSGLSADAMDVDIDGGRAAEVNRFLVTNGFDVSAVVPRTKSLEEFYFSLVGGAQS
jgi:ABC-2 type transport system ATP-binding protein